MAALAGMFAAALAGCVPETGPVPISPESSTTRPRVLVVESQKRAVAPTSAAPAFLATPRPSGEPIERRPGDMAAQSLAEPKAPGRAKMATPVAKSTATAVPTAIEGPPYPTPTLRPAHPPRSGSAIIPRVMQPNTRDNAQAAGFLRHDSVTPVPLVRYPSAPVEELAPEEPPVEVATP
jgi:hypothetical protein